MGKKILVVDDDKKIVEVVRLYLERNGYSVVTAYEGEEALQKFKNEKPALVVLDLMLPQISGQEICRRIRQESTTPIIMLTARTTENDRINGLDMGADDYVTKPFSPRELVSRVKAVLRRTQEEYLWEKMPDYHIGELTINFKKHSAEIQGKVLNLTPTEFKLLTIMAREPGRVFNRQHLIDRVLGYDFDGFDRTVDVHIVNLRKKLDSAGLSGAIKTIYGMGYKFEMS